MSQNATNVKKLWQKATARNDTCGAFGYAPYNACSRILNTEGTGPVVMVVQAAATPTGRRTREKTGQHSPCNATCDYLRAWRLLVYRAHGVSLVGSYRETNSTCGNASA